MCGIVGYFDKRRSADAPIGSTIFRMLMALGARGPDSSGVAIWGPATDDLVVRVKAGERSEADGLGREILRVARGRGRVHAARGEGPLIRFEIAIVDSVRLAQELEALSPDVEVLSIGRRLEIVKRVGAPGNLEAEFMVSKWKGTHAIGHTRLSTESRVDLSHSQPFWAHGMPDLAVVHNGHITNYHRLRRIYRQEGVRFYTENDSEIIGIYLARKLRAGLPLREALEASVRELDGSFSYLAATAEAFGFAKDPYCLKPLIVGESDHAVAIANEEIAVHAALGASYRAREMGAGAVAVWEIARARPTASERRGSAA